jgi:hypothetical protein
VLSSTGTQIGTLEHVLEVPELDVFDGIVIATSAGLRFIDADDVERITRSHIRPRITDTEAGQLPRPGGPPVYRVDALADTGQSLHDILGRLFRRPTGSASTTSTRDRPRAGDSSGLPGHSP